MRRSLLFIVGLAATVSLAACKASSAINIEQEQDGMKVEFNTGMPQGGVRDEKHGKETFLSVGAVMGVDGTNANGVAFGHAFEDGSYMLTGQLNIALPEDGTFYQAWLKNPATGAMVEAGRPKPLYGDVRHSFRFESAEDLKGFSEVIVTLEQDDGNTEPGTIVAKGTLKTQKR